MLRNTKQREEIRRVLRRAGRPLSPQEVLDTARPALPRLGIATVYRNLRALVEAQWLRAVELPGAPDRYEVAGKAHHHHFHCRSCDGLFEIEDCPGNLAALTPQDYYLERHEIFLYGLCDACGPP
ncbi:MAG: transcriptional repressor [Thermoanaerobaculia bacterium]|nr:transcriptional repressor [Thermoanaerobaculia bacterium]